MDKYEDIKIIKKEEKYNTLGSLILVTGVVLSLIFFFNANMFLGFIMILISFASSFILFNKYNKTRNQVLGIIYEKNLIHIGGHPKIEVSQNLSIQIRKDNKVYLGEEYIPIENIKRCEIQTQEQISNDVTFGRLVALGILAFAFKKENRNTTNYIALSLLLEGVEINCVFKAVFEKDNLGETAFEINKIRNEAMSS